MATVFLPQYNIFRCFSWSLKFGTNAGYSFRYRDQWDFYLSVLKHNSFIKHIFACVSVGVKMCAFVYCADVLKRIVLKNHLENHVEVIGSHFSKLAYTSRQHFQNFCRCEQCGAHLSHTIGRKPSRQFFYTRSFSLIAFVCLCVYMYVSVCEYVRVWGCLGTLCLCVFAHAVHVCRRIYGGWLWMLRVCKYCHINCPCALCMKTYCTCPRGTWLWTNKKEIVHGDSASELQWRCVCQHAGIPLWPFVFVLCAFWKCVCANDKIRSRPQHATDSSSNFAFVKDCTAKRFLPVVTTVRLITWYGVVTRQALKLH